MSVLLNGIVWEFGAESCIGCGDATGPLGGVHSLRVQLESGGIAEDVKSMLFVYRIDGTNEFYDIVWAVLLGRSSSLQVRARWTWV